MVEIYHKAVRSLRSTSDVRLKKGLLGLTITFSQFGFTALATYLTLVSPLSSSSSPPLYIPSTPVPPRKWALLALMFFAVNMLNNWAFAFQISVPVHIILRSFGSVTTMAAGWLWGKKYSRLQVFSVALLTVGVVGSALADAEAKVSSVHWTTTKEVS